MAKKLHKHDNGARLAAMLKESERQFKSTPADVLADEIGRLNAQVAALKSQLDPMCAELKERGDGRYLGTLYECVVYDQQRETLIAEKVRKFLHPNQLRHALRKQTVRCLDVRGRKTPTWSGALRKRRWDSNPRRPVNYHP